MTSAIEAPLLFSATAVIVFLIALTGVRLATFIKILPDNPNWRSSHTRATSRAGGIAIFSAWFAGMFVLAAFSSHSALAIAAGKFAGLTALAFLVGLADDRWTLPAAAKFAGQIGAAFLFVLAFGPLQSAPLPFYGETALGAAGAILAVFWIVGFMNAFNFMDGVNGIAGGVAVVGLSAFAAIAAFGGVTPAAVIAIMLAFACFGFLPANLTRGRLFMGDSGSQALGFVIAALGVYAANVSGGNVSVLIVPVIFLPFIFDVAWTLFHRLVRKRNILAAHREHLYQLMHRLGKSHLRVAIIYAALTFFCAAAAGLMLMLPPGLQWLVPGAIVTAFLGGAIAIYSAALGANLLETAPEETALQDARDTDVATSSPSAAE